MQIDKSTVPSIGDVLEFMVGLCIRSRLVFQNLEKKFIKKSSSSLKFCVHMFLHTDYGILKN